MKIAYVVGSFPASSQTFVANQILGVDKRGHEVVVYTTDHPAKGMPAAAEADGLPARTYSILCPGALWRLRT